MEILLDTHIALWAITDTEKLSSQALELLEAEENKVFYSLASVWEIAIKHKLHPNNMPIPEEAFVDFCEKTGFIQLPIRTEHIFLLKSLERMTDTPNHKDPFDRILLAQAKQENMIFITHDILLSQYGEECVLLV